MTTLAQAAELLESDGSIVIETSGSSGIPKRVRISAAALRASAEATAARIGAGQWLLALPTDYVAGLQVLVRSVLAGTETVDLPPGPFRADTFVAAATRMTGPRYTSLVPAQLRTLLDDETATAALAAFEAVLVGGQRAPSDLIGRCAGAGIKLVRTYGSSETSGGCVYNGYPLDGVQLRTVNGEVQVSGPVLADGYLDAAGALVSSNVFVTDDGVRWLRTGDLGAIAPNGELSILGRADRVLISGGVNVSLDRLETVLHAVPGLESAAAVAAAHERWGEVPVVFIAQTPRITAPGTNNAREVPPAVEFGAESLLAAARAAAESVIGPAAKPHAVHVVAAIPITPSGKPDYAELTRIVGTA